MTQEINTSKTLGLTSKNIATIALCLALLGIACGPLLMLVAVQEMTPNQIAFNRLIIAAIAFSGWNSFRPRTGEGTIEKPEFNLHTFVLLLGAGSSFAVFLILLAWSLTQTRVANASLLTHMMPIFTTLGAWLFFKKRFSKQFLVGLVVAIVGAVAIGLADLSLADGSLLGDGAALLSAVLFATEILLVEQLRTRLETPVIAMAECAIGSSLILPTLLLSGTSVLPSSWSSGLAVIGVSLLTQILGHGLITYSLKNFSAELISVALLAVPVIAATGAMFLFSQTISSGNALAFSVVLLGIYLTISAPKLA